MHQEGAFLLWGINPVVYSHSTEIDSDFIGDQEKYRFSKDERKKIYYIPSSKKESILKALNRLGINSAYISGNWWRGSIYQEFYAMILNDFVYSIPNTIIKQEVACKNSLQVQNEGHCEIW